MTSSWIDVARDALKLPGLLVEIYGDVAKPGARQVGRALETVVGLGNTILWPIALANERARMALEKNLEAYRRRMETVPEEQVTPVTPEIGVPIAEKLSYIQDETLSALYIELLAKASIKSTLAMVHPSFVNIINNITPDEAVLLQPFLSLDRLFVEVQLIYPNQTYITLDRYQPQRLITQTLIFPQNAQSYLSNLIGLGILESKDIEAAHFREQYLEIEDESRASYSSLVALEPGRSLNFTRGFVRLTGFGRKFMEACHIM
jgi:hypothetical protein